MIFHDCRIARLYKIYATPKNLTEHTCKEIICIHKQIFWARRDEWSSKFDKQVEVLGKYFTESEGGAQFQLMKGNA